MSHINGIRGIDVSTILGINKNKTVSQLYFEKVNLSKDKKENETSTEKEYWNNNIKQMIANEMSVRTGKKMRRVNGLLKDSEFEFLVSDVDRKVVGENSILICENYNICMPKVWNMQELTSDYLLRCQHDMRVANAEKCYVASLVRCEKLIIKEVLRDEEIINKILEMEKSFWNNHVLKKVVPSKEWKN